MNLKTIQQLYDEAFSDKGDRFNWALFQAWAVTDLQKSLTAALEALQFYADEKKWKWSTKPTDKSYVVSCGSEVQRDFGEKAQQALKYFEAE